MAESVGGLADRTTIEGFGPRQRALGVCGLWRDLLAPQRWPSPTWADREIAACATIEKRDVAAVGTALPTVGTVRVDSNGNIVGAASYFDTVVTPGWIAKSTDIDNDTVTCDADPGWATGEAVRVVQGYTNVPTNTGRVTPPTATVEPRAVYLQTDNTVTVPIYGWATGMKVQVSATGGGLTAGTDYFIHAINTTTIAFYVSAGDASNNVNRIDRTEDIQNPVRPYYTEGDVQRAVWELIENNPGDPGNWSPLRVAEILAKADEEVGLNDMSVDFVPDCDGTVAIIVQPFQVNGPSNEKLTIAQITVAQIPNSW